MNRAKQLTEALESCFKCNLPAETEFIIIDNASTDDTESAVLNVMKNCEYPYYYEKMSENLGIGKGRDYAYSKANGEIIYCLDDDAVISPESYNDFFYTVY